MDKEHIKEIIKELSATYAVSGATGVVNLKIVYRGEGLFYQSEGRAFICPMSVAGGWVESKNIKKWHTGIKITNEELGVIKSNILDFFSSTQEMQVTFID